MLHAPPRGACGSARDCQPLPLKPTCSLLSHGGSVQGEAVCAGRGALDVGQVGEEQFIGLAKVESRFTHLLLT